MKTSYALATDIPALENLINRAYRSKDGASSWTNEAHLLEGYRTDVDHLKELIDTPGSMILLCHSPNEELIGSVHLIQSKDHMYFGMLAVDPLHQSKGIGRFLLDTAKDLARSHELNQIKLTVLSTRHELIDWYTRSGFVIVQNDLPFPNTVRFGVPKMPLTLVEMKWVASAV